MLSQVGSGCSINADIFNVDFHRLGGPCSKAHVVQAGIALQPN